MDSKNQTNNKPGIKNLKPEEGLSASYPYYLKYVLLAVVLIITFWCYHYSLQNQFTNWDDDRYIVKNNFIKSFSAANLKMMLFHDVKMDNYIPVTVISYAINYYFSGLAPASYFITNLIIHLLNSCLVFFLVLKMLSAMENNGYGLFKWKKWMAFFCTLAFSIHPMHVESVSWISERKDVLYAFFYFLGMIAYLKYISTNEEASVKNSNGAFSPFSTYLIVFCLYILSLLSKPMALVFPLSLLSLDVLLKRDKSMKPKKIIIEKLPFLPFSLIAAIATYKLQTLSGDLPQTHFGFLMRLLFASYNFFMYLLKAIIPMPLSSYYPYPNTGRDAGNLPLIYYLSPLIVLLFVTILLYRSYKLFFRTSATLSTSRNNNIRVMLFGLGFYFFNMVLISQVITGPTILADRYTYVCYFGIFFTSTYFLYKLLQKSELMKKITVSLITVYLFILTVICYQRTKVWHDSETLWSDVIKQYEQYPKRIITAYTHLGLHYFTHSDYEKAYDNYKEAINLGTGYAQAYCNMGLIMSGKNRYDSALIYFSDAINIENNYALAYMERGTVYAKIGKYDSAINDYKHSLVFDPDFEILLRNIAFTYLKAGMFDSSISYYNHLLRINPGRSGYFLCRGVAEYYHGDIKPALDDFVQNLHMSPHDSECMYYLSMSYDKLNDSENAIKYEQMAKNSNYPVPSDYDNKITDLLRKKEH